MAHVQVCPACSGTGLSPISRAGMKGPDRTCHRCHGARWVSVDDPPAVWGASDTKPEKKETADVDKLA